MQIKKFDPTKPVQTRAGQPATILATDIDNPSYPIAARVRREDNSLEVIMGYRANGQRFPFAHNDHDLVNMPEKRTLFMNVPKPGAGSIRHYSTAENAKAAASIRPDLFEAIAAPFVYEVHE